MARGITQDQVNAAIDALVGAGERPTIERVRTALGTGSPNTLTRMLDIWWAQLHDRLTRQQVKLVVPDAPEDVAVAATRLWQLALEHAGVKAEQGMAAQREALARDQAALSASTASWEQRLQEAAAAVATADRDRDAADSRLRDLQRLLDRQVTQLADQQSRLSQAMVQAEDLSKRLEASQQALLAARSEAAADRSSLEASHRAAEDRWMQEVDKARQDEAKTAARLHHVESAAKAIGEKAAAETAQHLAQLRKTEQDVARKDARILVLEEQLERMHGQLSTALAAVGQGRTTTAIPKGKMRPPTKRKSPAMVLPSYPPDDGPLTRSQMREIKSRVPQGKSRSVRTDLLSEPSSGTTKAPIGRSKRRVRNSA
jgi:hypothetical protein